MVDQEAFSPILFPNKPIFGTRIPITVIHVVLKQLRKGRVKIYIFFCNSGVVFFQLIYQANSESSVFEFALTRRGEEIEGVTLVCVHNCDSLSCIKFSVHSQLNIKYMNFIYFTSFSSPLRIYYEFS